LLRTTLFICSSVSTLGEQAKARCTIIFHQFVHLLLNPLLGFVGDVAFAVVLSQSPDFAIIISSVEFSDGKTASATPCSEMLFTVAFSSGEPT
jgi:hypothetical protein